MIKTQSMQFLESELAVKENQPDSRYQIIPCPMEKTVSYGLGTSMGPQAIIEASQELERSSICLEGIYTQQQIDCSVDHEICLDELRVRARSVAQAGQFPVILGGEHSLTWAAVNGISESIGKKIGIVQIDAHADLRERFGGNPHSHASVMNLLVNQGHKLASIGVRALCEEERNFRLEHDVLFWDGEDLVRGNADKVFLPKDFPKEIYLSYDLDGLDPSIMPAVGTPVPGGLSYYQSIDLVKSALQGRKCVGMDLVELSPMPHDIVSPFTASVLLQRLMELV